MVGIHHVLGPHLVCAVHRDERLRVDEVSLRFAAFRLQELLQVNEEHLLQLVKQVDFEEFEAAECCHQLSAVDRLQALGALVRQGKRHDELLNLTEEGLVLYSQVSQGIANHGQRVEGVAFAVPDGVVDQQGHAFHVHVLELGQTLQRVCHILLVHLVCCLVLDYSAEQLEEVIIVVVQLVEIPQVAAHIAEAQLVFLLLQYLGYLGHQKFPLWDVLSSDENVEDVGEAVDSLDLAIEHLLANPVKEVRVDALKLEHGV